MTTSRLCTNAIIIPSNQQMVNMHFHHGIYRNVNHYIYNVLLDFSPFLYISATILAIHLGQNWRKIV